jgi:hypothetical protein
MKDNKMELQMESFNLNEMVKECVQDINYSSAVSTIKISQTGDFDIYGDKDRISQNKNSCRNQDVNKKPFRIALPH